MAWDKVKPANNEKLLDSPAQIRANWDALEEGTTAALQITNAKVAADAAIADTKLAQITTASKVSGAALTSLASVPAGAGSLLGANQLIAIEEKTDSYSLVVADAGKWIDINHASAKTLTVPTNASQAIPIGATIAIRQKGAGAVTIAAAGGVTINAIVGLVFEDQHGVACLTKIASDTWVAFGALKAV